MNDSPSNATNATETEPTAPTAPPSPSTAKKPRVLVIGGGSSLIGMQAARLLASVATVELVETDEQARRMLALSGQDYPELGGLRPIPNLARELSLCAPWPQSPASSRVVTAESGANVAPSYTEFVARKGGKWGASKRRP